MPSMKRSLVTTVCVSLLLAMAAPAEATTGTVTVKGNVYCMIKHDVVGIWVHSSGGDSKWATWSPSPYAKYNAYYSVTITASLPTSLQLHVGCGGTPQDWWSNNQTPSKSVSGSRVLNARCVDSAAGVRPGVCSFPPKGTARSTNPGFKGYCTWGAAEQFRGATGYYPDLHAKNDQAWTWHQDAIDKGFRVYSSIPAARSIVVFEPGTSSVTDTGANYGIPSEPPYGHVAWGLNIVQKSGAIFVRIREMNYDAFNVYDEKTVRHVPGKMSYILAP